MPPVSAVEGGVSHVGKKNKTVHCPVFVNESDGEQWWEKVIVPVFAMESMGNYD